MTKPRSQGRMIRVDIAEDEGLAKLSDGAARMHFYLYPHLNSYGKFSGGPGTITENVIPLLRWSRKKILSYLAEINTHTSMKVWTHNGRFFVHDLRFSQQQEIREDRRGQDTLPSYPGANRMKTGHSKYSLPEYVPDLLPREVEVEVQGEEEREVEIELEVSRALPSPPLGGGGAAAFQKINESNGKATLSDKGNEADFPDYVVAEINRLSEESRKTMLITVNDYNAGTIPREEAVAIVAPFEMVRRTIDALFPIMEG